VHELSLCRSIFDIAERAREGRTVAVVNMQIGQLRQVVPRTLEYCWGLVTEQTELRGSRLSIEHVEVELRCRSCAATTVLAHRLVLACSGCGSADVHVVRGEELLVLSMDLDD
jgi:hydrogenase nickel incorporation protein HypA/HybF